VTEYFGTGTKKGRGMAQESLALIEAMYLAAEAAQPITGRGIGYKLFTLSLIASMAKPDMRRVYRLLKEARERGGIPWEWIVDETRELEKVSTWANPTAYVRAVARSYRRDFWDQQPCRVIVVSEKGTVRGLLRPVLDQYAVGFQVMHGFSSATTIYDLSQEIFPKTMMDDRWSYYMSATSTRAVCSCRRSIYPSGSPNMTATM